MVFLITYTLSTGLTIKTSGLHLPTFGMEALLFQVYTINSCTISVHNHGSLYQQRNVLCWLTKSKSLHPFPRATVKFVHVIIWALCDLNITHLSSLSIKWLKIVNTYSLLSCCWMFAWAGTPTTQFVHIRQLAWCYSVNRLTSDHLWQRRT